MKVTTRAATLLAAALMTIGLSACGDDTEATPPAGQSSSADPSEQGSSAAPSTPATAAATGPELSIDVLSLRTAELADFQPWRIRNGGANSSAGTYPLDPNGPAAAGITVSIVSIPQNNTLEELAGIQAESLAEGLTRGEDVTIDGEPSYAFTGTVDDVRRYVYGGIAGDQAWTLEFEIPAGMPDPERVVDPMLASIQRR